MEVNRLMGFELALAAEIVSAAAALTLVYSTLKPCKSSGIQYLLGVPAGFALIAIGFITGIPSFTADANVPSIRLVSVVISLLTQTYGLLFISLTYARKTRLRILGEFVILEIAIPALITIGAVTFVLISDRTTGVVISTIETPLRVVMALCTLYVLYETERNWSFTQKASDGIVAVAFGFLFVEQLGFLLAPLDFGGVAIFLGYEGRLVGLAILIALTILGVQKADFVVLKRLGLTALAH
jgi:hypothetical protein